MQRYTTTLLALLLSAIAGLAALNLLVDPYGVVGGPAIDGFNSEKTRRMEDGGRIAVGGMVMRGGMNAAVFGSSRTVDGFPRFTNDWPGGLSNAGMRGSNIYELTRAIALAARDPGLRCVIVGVDLDEFGDHSKNKATYWTSALADGDAGLAVARMALSPNTFYRSVQTVIDNAAGRAPTPPFLKLYPAGAQRRRYERSVENSAAFMRSYQLDDERLALFDAALDRLTEQGVQVTVFIHPIHAWREEVLFRTGGKERYFNFRRELASLVAAYAERRPAAPCAPGGAAALWDFSGFQDVAVTPPPTPGARIAQPYFHEPAHYLPAVGEAMLARILGADGAGVFARDRFGILLTPQTAKASEDEIETRREQWLQTPAGREFEERLDATLKNGVSIEAPVRQYLNRDDWRDMEILLDSVPPRALKAPGGSTDRTHKN